MSSAITKPYSKWQPVHQSPRIVTASSKTSPDYVIGQQGSLPHINYVYPNFQEHCLTRECREAWS